MGSYHRLSESAASIHLVNKGDTPAINPVFTITANDWAAALDMAARRNVYPKVRQKSKSSGASPQRNFGAGDNLGSGWTLPLNLVNGEEFINIITSSESVYEDFEDNYSNSNSYFGSNSKQLQVPSTTQLLTWGDGSNEEEGRKQRSSSITVPIPSGHHYVGRCPERCKSEVYIGRRCSSASPKGRYRQQLHRQEECHPSFQRTSGSVGTSPNRRGRDRGFSLTLTTAGFPSHQLSPSRSPQKRRASQTARRRRSTHSQRKADAFPDSDSSLSSRSPSRSPNRRRSSCKKRNVTNSENPSQLPRQRTLSMPTEFQISIPLVKAALGKETDENSNTDPKEEFDSGSGSLKTRVSKKEDLIYDVVIIGSSNVGKATLVSEYFNQGKSSGSSGSDQGIGSEEDDDEDLVSNRKAVVFKPQLGLEDHSTRSNSFALRIFCQQTPAVSHLYKYDAVIVLYSVTDRDSFEFARKALGEIGRGKVVILVGGKTDLERSRCVSSLEGRTLATAYDVKFIEISSTLGIGVTELQKGLVTQIHLHQLSKRPPVPRPQNQCGTKTNCLRKFSLKHTSSSSSSSSNSLIGRVSAKGNNKESLRSLKLARKLIDRIMNFRIPGTGKTKSCLDLHSL